MLGPHLQRIKLDPVGHDQRHRVTAAHAERGESRRNATHLCGVLVPGPCLGVSSRSKRHCARVDRCGALERLTQRYRPRGDGHCAVAAGSVVTVVNVEPSMVLRPQRIHLCLAEPR